jgi:hypothetical protein
MARRDRVELKVNGTAAVGCHFCKSRADGRAQVNRLDDMAL